MTSIGRFAPSTTGPAHPGTLLAALLAWLDARASGGQVSLRLEDLDPERCRPEYARGLVDALAWLGLDFDGTSLQSAARSHHEEALDQLAAMGLLYPCSCSRTTLKASAERAPDGSWRYPGTCQGRSLPEPAQGGWRAVDEAIRLRLPDEVVIPHDEGGLDLTARPGDSSGDPIVRRRDGAVAYHLASVVDDARLGVDRIVRGRDLALSTVTQCAITGLLGAPLPTYRHHFLLLEPRGEKLAKLHGSIGFDQVRAHYSGIEFVGWLAYAAQLLPEPRPMRATDLVEGFDWKRVRVADRGVSWNREAGRLELDPSSSG